MRDWISDWKKWSRAERWFAIMLIIIALVLPLGLLIIGERVGSLRWRQRAAALRKGLAVHEASQ